MLWYRQNSYSLEEAQRQEHILEAIEPNQSVKELAVYVYKAMESLPHGGMLSTYNVFQSVGVPSSLRVVGMGDLSQKKEDKLKKMPINGSNGDCNAPSAFRKCYLEQLCKCRERQYRDHHVKKWLDELKDEVFKAQDLLDDIATEASQQKLYAELQSTAVICKVRGLFTTFASRNHFDKKIDSGIKELLNNLENLIKQKKRLGLKEGPSAHDQLAVMNRGVYKRLPSTHLIAESNIYGRDADKERIVEILLSQNMGCRNQLPMDVIAVTGMGGMGKTTLARLVYEDVRIKDQFQHRAWMCVSEAFDVDQVTKAILHSLSCPIEQDFHSNQATLGKTLMGKKFFLVLDDVWNENCEILEVFTAPLKNVAPQSKILITTRNGTVAEAMCCTFRYPLKPLQDGDGWDLFAKHAFNNQHHAVDPDLIQIGREIINKGGGSPLAIKTLGRLLHRKLSFQHWNKILKSEIWELSENDSNIISSLRLSYHYLPSNLKRCFVYCSIFPKDYHIDKNNLIQLWMADGLIFPTQKSMSLEEAGDEIFNYLVSRSFFEPSRKGDNYFIMHDLVNDLAKSMAGEFSVQLEVDQAQDMSTKTRYFSYMGNINQNNLETFEKVLKCQQLCSFILFLDRHFSCNYVIGDNIMSRLSHLNYLRELSLKGSQNLRNLTDGIGNLKHLHYLDLSWTTVKKLPDSMCLLINLQTLKLKGCEFLTKLPSNLYKLINLHHLDLKDCGIQKIPRYMGKLNQLRTMNKFVVAKKGGSELKELSNLNHLTGSLSISNMQFMNDPANSRGANLKEKKLDTLKLLYWRYICSREEAQHQEHVLEALEPSDGVKELIVEGYGGTKFPKWFGDSHFLPNLVSLCLYDCDNVSLLPPLGQLPSLQKLVIENFVRINMIGEEFYGNGSLIAPFPSLSCLHFSNMRKWEEWDICQEGAFPLLEELHIKYCHRLTKSLPQHLPCLKTLDISRCENLEAPLPKSSCMEKLCLSNCKKMLVKDMPTWSSQDMLPPLHVLYLNDCRAIDQWLPFQEGMLSSLQRLTIHDCSKLIASLRDLGLHEFLSFKELDIGGTFDMKSFPEEGLLPPNLQSLTLKGCYNLERINHRGLLHLQSLTFLSFQDCPHTTFEGMPEHGLPPSLSHLSIGFNCPLLEERCEMEQGPDWPKIAHIPHVLM
ncbi:putative disease resistance RPP13-like protein 1 [Neltuma alba]|uniref:putative disease resistance RPP13-like protein 1 n=1 Tax=Neltuma alba TaxID=207710 RepID=UPI0010A320BF|nr:putative disease resistance RPP13-like protein 1 [Prosopis alba]